MKIKSVILYQIQAKLKAPFKTSYGMYKERESIILEIKEESGITGWGEVVAFSHPWYTEETTKTAYMMLKEYLIPILLNQSFEHPKEFIRSCKWIKGNNMAKAGIEGALWDVYATLQNRPLYQVLGGERNYVDVGVVVGLGDTDSMIAQIEQYAKEGYKRFKIKISPSQDVPLVKEIRRVYPHLPLMVDANSAYTLNDMKALKALDEYHLMMIEQPFGQYDFVDHGVLQKSITTPICLDESITSLDDVKTVHGLGCCDVINIKSGRVGGLYNSKQIHDYCRAVGIPVWCGGMLEFGVSRLQNLALCTLPNFTIPADLSASSRYYEEDIITPEVIVTNGQVMLSDAPGIGAEINREVLQRMTIHQEYFR